MAEINLERRNPGDEDPHALGPDIEAMILAMGVQLRSIEPITTLQGSALDRSVFLLRMDDGSLLKARRVDLPQRAARVLQASKDLGHPAFAAILAARGHALIEEWVPGTPLSELPETPVDAIRSCGSILAELHSIPPPEDRWGPVERSNEKLHKHVRRVSQELQLLDCISEARSLEIMEYLRAEIPQRIQYGFVHQDLAPENVIRDPESRLRVIDNANFDVFPCDLDIARSWYRWPLRDDDALTAFLQGYETRRSLQGFHEKLPVWALITFMKAAWFRRRSMLGGLDLPLAMLDRLWGELARGQTRIDLNSLWP